MHTSLIIVLMSPTSRSLYLNQSSVFLQVSTLRMKRRPTCIWRYFRNMPDAFSSMTSDPKQSNELLNQTTPPSLFKSSRLRIPILPKSTLHQYPPVLPAESRKVKAKKRTITIIKNNQNKNNNKNYRNPVSQHRLHPILIAVRITS